MAGMHKNKENEDLGQVSTQSQVGVVMDDPASGYDAVFGEIGEGGPNYRNVRAVGRKRSVRVLIPYPRLGGWEQPLS